MNTTSIDTKCRRCGEQHSIQRGDVAVTLAQRPQDCEKVEIVRAEYLRGYYDPSVRDRWLHVRFADGGRLLVHQSNLCKTID